MESSTDRLSELNLQPPSYLNKIGNICRNHKKLIIAGIVTGALAALVLGLAFSGGLDFSAIVHKMLNFAQQTGHTLANIGLKLANLMSKTHSLALWKILGLGAGTALIGAGAATGGALIGIAAWRKHNATQMNTARESYYTTLLGGYDEE